MKYASIILMLVAVRLCAAAQMRSGTIISFAFDFPHDEVVVAADSESNDGYDIVYNRCKIVALGNELIVAASGFTGEGPLPGPPIWDAQTIARQEFNRLHGKGAPKYSILTLVNAWGKATKIKTQGAMNRLGARFPSDGTSIMRAVFVGLDRNNHISVIIAHIGRNGKTAEFGIDDSPTTQTGLVLGEPQVMEMMSRIQNEGPSGPLHGEMQGDGRYGEPDLVFQATEPVRLAIRHPPIVKNQRLMPIIGGALDAVGFTPLGARWLYLKQGCPAQ